MTAFIFVNDINTQLAGSISSSSTSITLASSQNLPSSIPAGENLVITLRDAATRQNTEIVYATAITGTTLTVVRGQEGTTAQSWATGDYAYSGVTAGQMLSVNAGRLLGPPVVITANGTYNASPGTKAVVVEVIPAGGGSQGVAVTNSGQWGGSSGGGGGAYAVGYYESGFDGVTVTIGAGGVAGTGGSGAGKGGTTSFGSLLSAEGGFPGGSSVVATSSGAALIVGGNGGTVVTGSGIIYKASGIPGGHCFLLQNSQLGGVGGGSGKGGAGGVALGNSTFTSNPGVTPGSGAGGITSQVQAAKAGAAGAPGEVIVWEYA